MINESVMRFVHVSIEMYQGSPWVLFKKADMKKFVKFAGKHL